MLMERLDESLDRAIAVGGNDDAIFGADPGELGRFHHLVSVGKKGEGLAVAERLINEVDG